ncbi:MAG: hypothetical protein ABS43_28195 [Bordetella sp. SCN 67-23]|nr:MAG: hypothetical protein ABS43_28195 [Bordetella sp. SCN 67-23]
MSICSIEDVAENTDAPFWFQLYVMRDRDPLAQLDRREVGLVGAIGAFGPGPGVGVLVEHLRYAPFGEQAQVLDAGDHGHGGGRCDGAGDAL